MAIHIAADQKENSLPRWTRTFPVWINKNISLILKNIVIYDRKHLNHMSRGRRGAIAKFVRNIIIIIGNGCQRHDLDDRRLEI